MDLKQIEELMKLMVQYKVDCVEVDGVKVFKPKHDPSGQKTDNLPSSKRMNLSDEELLFYSTTQSLTLKDIEDLEAGKLVLNPTKSNKG